MQDPMKDIEDEQAQKDIGRFVARIYKGAYEELKDHRAAFWITVAYCIGLNNQVKAPEDEEDDANSD